MEILLQIALGVLTFIAALTNFVCNLIIPKQKPTYPAISNKLLTKSVSELIVDLRQKKLTSEELVSAYIKRIKEVNPSLNAVIEDRFDEALKEAQHADQLIAKAKNEELSKALFTRYPLLGIPFTVKESCSLKGLSHVVGSVFRKGIKSTKDGEVVELLRAAGSIPLLVSANPELCMSFETNTKLHGQTRNPYDQRRTAAGSSGGEGALNGSGSSLFGVGSDIAGSIRLPALYCGVFGHKPTGGLLSCKGHFPGSTKDPNFNSYLQLGPITRFARDMPLLLQIMAGSNANKIQIGQTYERKNIKIHYALSYDRLNNLVHLTPNSAMKTAVIRAVKYFEKAGCSTKEVKIHNLKNVGEIGTQAFINLEGVPSVITQTDLVKPKKKALIFEFLRSLFGHSLFTKEALFMELMPTISSPLFLPAKYAQQFPLDVKALKDELLTLLGTNGVLFFPTSPLPALHINTSLPYIGNIFMMSIFNILGFPVTQVPMGLDYRGLPVGFQVIAAPYQDNLCLQIAIELEAAFGGWVPPISHAYND